MLQPGSENLHFNKLPKEFLLILTFENLSCFSILAIVYILLKSRPEEIQNFKRRCNQNCCI